MLTDHEIDALAAMANAATQGPWGISSSGRSISVVDATGLPVERGQRSTGDHFPLVAQVYAFKDATFIAAVRQKVLALCQHAREANGLLRDLCEDSKAVAEVLCLRRAMTEALSLIRSDDREGGGRAYRKSAPAKLTTIADSLRAALEGPRHDG